MNLWLVNGWIMLALIGFLEQGSIFCWSLNDEGIALLKFRERVVNDPFGALSSWSKKIGENNPCTWFGIGCDHGRVVSLNLKNLCLEGTIAPELYQLLNIKSIILRNNSLYGFVPEEIGKLKELELLDLGYNNFTIPLMPEFRYNISVLLSDNNGLCCNISSELERVLRLSEVQMEESLTRHQRMLQQLNKSPLGQSAKAVEDGQPPPGSQSPPRSPLNRPSPPRSFLNRRPQPPRTDSSATPSSLNPSSVGTSPPLPPNFPTPSLDPTVVSPPPSADVLPNRPSSKAKLVPIVSGSVGGFVGLCLIVGLLLWGLYRFRKDGPRSRGLTGQLKQAFVSGIPNLKRSELETACEDFSNVIGTSSIGTIYKGTLSNGVEIAAISVAASFAKDWSENLETQFRKKIETLSKVNHKNFVSLIGYCEEEEPFTRMMVFEYAPNGSLFEHLHVKEAEHLDWGMRLRIAIGMAYCLEHMHHLEPPITHPNLNSSAVSLSEDYAAKISDFCFWNEVAAVKVKPLGLTSLDISSASPESNVYSFGLVLLEMMTGRILHTAENSSSIEDWFTEYLEGEKPLQELIDPMLRRYKTEQLEMISDVIEKCLHSDPQLRPTMKDVTARLKEIMGIERDKAAPRLSPLWWAELEGNSLNGSQMMT